MSRNPWAVVRVCVVNLATIFAVTDCSATTREWMGLLGFGEFTDPGSWLNGVPTNNTTSDVALFYGYLGGPVFNTVNLSVERSVRGLEFLAPQGLGSAVEFEFSGERLFIGEDGIRVNNGAGIIQTINNPVRLAAPQSWAVTNSNLYLHGPLSGAGDILKTGNGSLVWTGSNTNTGRTTIVQGLLMVTGSGRLSDKSTVEVAVNGVLRLDGMTDAINGLYGSGLIQLFNNATLVVGNSINDSQGIGYFQGRIEGTGGKLFKRGPEGFGLGDANTYTGGTRVETGMLVIDNSTGSATGSGAVEVYSPAILTGGGSIAGAVTVFSGGVIAPGIPDESLFAKDSLMNVGEFLLHLGATLEIELGGRYVGENTDTLAADSATIVGYLDVSLLPGFTPDYGDVFEILTSDSPILGTFAGLPQGALVGNFAGTDIFIDYTAEGGTAVLLRAGRTGDFDLDGDVDGRDFLTWQRNPSVGDLADWQANYGAGSFTAAEATSQVPEPGSFALVVIVGIVAVFRGKVTVG